MDDKTYTEGFPEKWAMVHRDDCTLLGYRGDLNLFGSLTIVCAAPKLKQGEAWLDTAKAIAHAMDGERLHARNLIMEAFCDKCGIGPPYGANDQPMPNVRASVTWQCDQCDHMNDRPRDKHCHSITDAAAIAVDLAIKNAGHTKPKLSAKIEKLIIQATEIAIATERAKAEIR
jgi:hypothetical protein